MAIVLALLASADPVTIQQFSDALQELSISPDVCREVFAAARPEEAKAEYAKLQ